MRVRRVRRIRLIRLIRRRSSGHGGRSDGSVLALMPAVFLVLILLGALAVDSAVTYLGQRQLHDAMVAAASDSVAAALDDPSFYGQGRVVLDPVRVAAVACASVRAQHLSEVKDLRVWVGIGGASVRVRATARVDAVFGRAIPGFGTRSVTAVAVARLANGPLAPRAPRVTSSLVTAPVACAATG
jgi:hypothetical protein